MNLYLAGWGDVAKIAGVADARLRSMTRTFPQLDPDTAFTESGHRWFVAAMHHRTGTAGRNRYADRHRNGVTVFDGLPIEPDGRFDAGDARQLTRHADESAGRLVGHFAVVRAGTESGREYLNVATDPMGVAQVYVHRGESSVLVGNSVRLIESVIGCGELDPLGVSTFLTFGWAAADRTLRRDVELLPASTVTEWSDRHPGGVQTTDRPRRSWTTRARGALTEDDVRHLATRMTAATVRAASRFDRRSVGLTGGRDSRVVAGCCVRGGIETAFYTRGGDDDGSPASDAALATTIADRMDLRHTVRPRTSHELVDRWDVGLERLTEQLDGMVSGWQIGDVVNQNEGPSSIDLLITGHGGEIARGAYARSKLFRSDATPPMVFATLAGKFFKNAGGLLRSDTIDTAERHLRQYLSEASDEGFAAGDLIDLFYVEERCRRWQSMQIRKNRVVSEKFSPMFSRDFADAAMRMSPRERFGQRLHHRLIRHLLPDLAFVPFTGASLRRFMAGSKDWRTIAAKIVREAAGAAGRNRRRPAASRPNRRAEAVRAKISDIRQCCLDGPREDLWLYVDRDRLSELLSSPELSRGSIVRLEKILDLIGLCHYAGRRNPRPSDARAKYD